MVPRPFTIIGHLLDHVVSSYVQQANTPPSLSLLSLIAFAQQAKNAADIALESGHVFLYRKVPLKIIHCLTSCYDYMY